MTRHYVPLAPVSRLMPKLIAAQGRGRLGRWLRHLLILHGTDAPPSVGAAEGLRLPHAGAGVVIARRTKMGRNVTIFHRVTIGRADVWRPDPDFGGFEIGDDAILGAGCALISQGPEPLRVGEGTVIGANAVLTRSTGDWEIWAGNPARKVADRDRAP
jgi:serine O-acetyltransferase